MVILLGRPKKSTTMSHLVGVRLTDRQWKYLQDESMARQLKISDILRGYLDERINSHIDVDNSWGKVLFLVSRNNDNLKKLPDAKRVPHFALRKLSVGVASVLLGTTLYFGFGTGVVHADTIMNSLPESGTALSTSTGASQSVEKGQKVGTDSASISAADAVPTSGVNLNTNSSANLAANQSAAQVINHPASSSATQLVNAAVTPTATQTATGYSANAVNEVVPSSRADLNSTNAVNAGSRFNLYLTNLAAVPASTQQTVRFDASHWSYGHTTGSDGRMIINLTGYWGSDTNVYIPNAADWRDQFHWNVGQVTISNDVMTKIANKYGVTKITVSNKNGEKVLATGTTYDAAGPSNLTDSWGGVFASNDETAVRVGEGYGPITNHALTSLDLSGLDVSQVTSLGAIFANPHLMSITGIDDWNTSKVFNFTGAFAQASSLVSPLDLSKWNTSSAKFMSMMFYYDGKLPSIGDISKWDLSHVVDTNNMFTLTEGLSSIGDLSNWNVANVTDMNQMFAQTGVSNLGNLNNWQVGKVTDFNSMFMNSEKLTNIGDLSKWDMHSATNVAGMFDHASALSSIGDLSNWNMSNVLDSNRMFNAMNSVTSLGDLSKWNVAKDTDMNMMFADLFKVTTLGHLDNWQTGNVKNMFLMFGNTELNKSLNDIGDLSKWDTSKVTNMLEMFGNTAALESVGDLSNWNTANVTTLNGMFTFSGIKALGNIGKWNTSKVTDFSGMFNGESGLTDLGDLSNWDVSHATAMNWTFANMSNLNHVSGFDHWNTQNVSSMQYMFWGATSLNLINFGGFKLRGDYIGFINGVRVSTVIISDNPSQFTSAIIDYPQKNNDGSITNFDRMPRFAVTGSGAKSTGEKRNVVAMTQAQFDSEKKHIITTFDKVLSDKNDLNYGTFKAYADSDVLYNRGKLLDTLKNGGTDGTAFQVADILTKMVDGTYNKPGATVSLPKNSQGLLPSYLDVPYSTFALFMQSQEYQTRTVTVHYKYADGDKKDQQAAPDAVLQVFYQRTRTVSADGKVTYSPWTWDESKGDKSTPGYHVVSGTWSSLPESWAVVSAAVPSIDGYVADTAGDSTNTNHVPANLFVFPTYTNSGTSDSSKDSIAYTTNADTYEARPEHTIWYCSSKDVEETRTITVHWIGNVRMDSVLNVYFKHHQQYDRQSGKYVDSNYTFDTSRGDLGGYWGNGGLHVVSGKWLIPTQPGHTIVALAPVLPGCTFYDKNNKPAGSVSESGSNLALNEFNDPNLNNPSDFWQNDYLSAPDSGLLASGATLYAMPDGQTATIKFIDDTTGKTLKTVVKNGFSDMESRYNTKSDIDFYLAEHYALVSDSTNGQLLVFDHDDKVDQNYEVHLKHVTQNVTDTQTKHVTVQHVYAENQPKSGKASSDVDLGSVTFTRTGVKDLVTGQTNWSAWDHDSQETKVVNSPVVNDYVATDGRIQTIVHSNDESAIIVTVSYYHNGRIIPVDPTGAPISDAPQPVYRTDPTDASAVTLNESVPNISGYVPAQSTVSPTSLTENTLVVYHKIMSIKFNLVDATGKPIKSENVSGIVGQTVSVADLNKLLPEGYEFYDGQLLPSSVVFGNSDRAYDLVVKHKLLLLDSDTTLKQGDLLLGSMSVRLADSLAKLKQQYTETIRVYDPTSSIVKDSKTIVGHFTRSVYVDLATGRVVAYTPWSEGGKHAFVSYRARPYDGWIAPVVQSHTVTVDDSIYNWQGHYQVATDWGQVTYKTLDGTLIASQQINDVSTDFKLNVPAGYVALTDVSSIKPGHDHNQNYVVYVRPNATTYTSHDSLPAAVSQPLTKSVTRVIKITMPNGHLRTVKQVVNFTRRVTVNNDGTVTYSDWQANSRASFNKIFMAPRRGYHVVITDKKSGETLTAVQAVKSVTADMPDSEIDVKYVKD